MFPISRLWKLLLIAVGFMLVSSVTRAATIVVDGTGCTLAEAIMAANTNAPRGGCRAGNDRSTGGDIIELRHDVVLAFWDNLDSDGCPNGLPAVTSRIQINGNHHIIARDNVSGVPSFRLLDSSEGQLTLNQLTVKNGQGELCDGGGIKGNIVTLIDSTIAGNTVFLANGGGIVAKFLTLIASTVSDNFGGGIFVDGNALVFGSTITRNDGVNDFSGGGLDIRGNLVLDRSTVSQNRGGGAWAIGGGLYVDGTAFLTNTTVWGNIASGDIGVGGGLFLYRGTATLVNSTVSGNIAKGGSSGANYSGSGGGIFSTGIDPAHTGPGGVVSLIHSTVSNNSAIGPFSPPAYVGGTGGGILSDSLNLTNTVVSGNVATNAAAGDCSAGEVHYKGLNLIGDGSCDAASFAQLTGDAMLLPLGNYGGPTLTQSPAAGSPLIDMIARSSGRGCSFATFVRTDQRGFRRPYPADDGCDIGAVEYIAPSGNSPCVGTCSPESPIVSGESHPATGVGNAPTTLSPGNTMPHGHELESPGFARRPIRRATARSF
jgi:hypothetical protein